jgi:DNA-binding Xre family transcriptional regulator
MTKEWAAVATALNYRMTELGMRQNELITRARVSKSAVHEIRHNTTQRRRNARTLEALSVALDWHPHHLAAILEGHSPPQIGDPFIMSDRDMADLLTAINRKLSEIERAQNDELRAIKGQLTDMSAMKRRLTTTRLDLRSDIEGLRVQAAELPGIRAQLEEQARELAEIKDLLVRLVGATPTASG